MKSVARLSKNFQPSNYQLTLVVTDLKATQFSGHVTISGRKAGRPSQRITLHQHGLTIDSAKITKRDKKGERDIPVTRINNQNSLDEVRLHTDELLYAGEYEVYVTFHGTITRTMTGLYPCFFNLNGEEHTMLMTQFESHYARYVFPCVDEPEAKATFDLTLVTPPDLTVLGNTPIAKQEGSGSQTTSVSTTFETTPKMSTYLLAFVVGELQSKTTKTKHGTDVSVWATIAQPMDALDYALEIAKQSIEFFEDYFGIRYPLAKADHVAVPDFTVGAMENWGLVTYRERLLLAYPGEASHSIKEYIAMVIAHETSHQWFGNLVTMKWWDDLWLNESFANMMEYQALDSMFPDWHVWESFIMSEGLAALRRDATPGVQAVKTDVHHPDEINTLFDHAIVYAKGGRLLYMLKSYLGEDVFRKGLTNYFKQHAYGNTTGADLWQALSEASGIDVGAFMNPWLERSGFPVVAVNKIGTSVTLEQKHFLESGEQSDGRIWPVPLFSSYDELPKRLDAEQLRVQTADKAEPLVINQGAAGHYLVNYEDADHRAAITGLVSSQKLGVTDRLMLLNGASMLSKAGVQSFSDALELLAAYQNEQAEPVWDIMALVTAEARRFIDLDESLEPYIKTYIRALTANEYKRLGWDEQPNESTADSKLRATIIGLGAYAEEPTVIQTATEKFTAYVNKHENPTAELRGIVFGVAVREKVADAFGYLLNLHDETANSDLKADIMAALTSTRDIKEAAVLLERLFDSHIVKPQDADYWLFYLLRNRYTRSTAWDWMVEHWKWVEETYGSDKAYDDFPRYAAGVCNTKAWQQKYTDFFEPKRSDLILERNISIGLSEINTRVRWLERDLKSVQVFFKK